MDLVKIVNAVIRSTIEYACPIYGNSAKSNLKHLDAIYNSALRFASGLPKWTPIFKLYKELNQSPLTFRRNYLSSSFYIRCADGISLNTSSEFPTDDLQWSLDNSLITPNMLIHSYWPYGYISDYVEIITKDLIFQTKNLPPSLIRDTFYAYISEFHPNSKLIATDGSKDDRKTSIAAVNITENSYSALLIHKLNSIFTAEALAINLAVNCFLNEKCNYIIVTDSKSTLDALKSITYKSPAVILKIYHSLRKAYQTVNKITLIWVPGHNGIYPNEKADYLAKNGPFGIFNYDGISPEDIKKHLKNKVKEYFQHWWSCSKYAEEHCHLGNSIYKWCTNRKEDVITARLRTLSAVTEERLYKCKLNTSPICQLCSTDNGNELHYIFTCGSLCNERRMLFQMMNLTNIPTWQEFWTTLNNNHSYFSLFLKLFLRSGKF